MPCPQPWRHEPCPFPTCPPDSLSPARQKNGCLEMNETNESGLTGRMHVLTVQEHQQSKSDVGGGTHGACGHPSCRTAHGDMAPKGVSTTVNTAGSRGRWEPRPSQRHHLVHLQGHQTHPGRWVKGPTSRHQSRPSQVSDRLKLSYSEVPGKSTPEAERSTCTQTPFSQPTAQEDASRPVSQARRPKPRGRGRKAHQWFLVPTAHPLLPL